jgi:predicted MFS family arabinose efflux permease
MAGYNFGGIPGWRLAFFLMACVSSLIGWLVHTFVVDPRDRLSKSGISSDRITNGYAILFLCYFCFSLAHGVQLAKYTLNEEDRLSG